MFSIGIVWPKISGICIGWHQSSGIGVGWNFGIGTSLPVTPKLSLSSKVDMSKSCLELNFT